jgi:putative ABC transport system permease protein
MFLALREIRHARLRFALIAVMIVLVSSLVFIISGLATGLSTGNTAAIYGMPVDRLVISTDSDKRLDRSTVSAGDAAAIAKIDGITLAEPIGISAANLKRDGHDELIGASLFGIAPDGVMMPHVTDGSSFTAAPGTNPVVVDETLKNDGVHLGDTVTITPDNVKLTIVGFTSGETYRLSPVIYLPIDLWQSLQPKQTGLPDDPATAILVKGSGAAFHAIPTAVAGTMVTTKGDVANAIPGESAQNSTLLMIQIFLVVIAAGIIAAFFYIVTLQKTGELGVMKALGAHTGYLTQALVMQAIVVTLVGVAVGIAIAAGIGAAVGTAMPYDITAARMLLFGGVLLLVAILGTSLSLTRIARIDPLDAINKVA